MGRLLGATVVTAATCLAVVVGSAETASAATQTVTNCNDSGPGSLRQAVANAGSGDTIDFALSPPCSTVTLTSGPIVITEDLTITGPGANTLAVSGDNNSKVFTVDAGITVAISGLTIEDGYNPGGYCFAGCQASGGGIENEGTLTLTDDVVTDNAAYAGCVEFCGALGGGIENDDTGVLTLTDTTVSDNIANGTCSSACSGTGGGIINYGTLTLTDSTFSGNTSISACVSNCGASGGGVANETGSTATVTDSSFDGNDAHNYGCTDQCGASGGAIDNSGTLTVTNSNIADNTAQVPCATQCAPFGGGIANESTGTLTLTSSILTANSAVTACASGCNPQGGGLYNDGTASVESSTIIDSGQLGGDCYLATPLIDLGGNVDDDGTCFLPHDGSLVAAVVQVETNPSYSGDPVLISSPQLQSACGRRLVFETLQGGSTTAPRTSSGSITVVLDNEGNATVVVQGAPCAAGHYLVEADLTTAPYLTATTTVDVEPPSVTATGVTADPSTEVETGDSATSGESDVYTVFYVETSPVYAEQPVQISSPQLEDRCGSGWRWEPATGTPIDQGSGTTTATGVLDDDGNAVFVFKGSSCAAGTSTVTADVLAGTHPTYTTTFTVAAPAVTLSPRVAATKAKVHRKHHKKTGTGGTGTPDPTMTVTANPNPVVETGVPTSAGVAPATLNVVKSDNATPSPGTSGPPAVTGVLFCFCESAFQYTITVTNSGPGPADGVQVTDTFSTNSDFDGDTYTTSTTGGASDTEPAGTANGYNDIDDTVYLPPHSSITYTVVPQIDFEAESLTNTASLTPPAGLPLTAASNLTATDNDYIWCGG